MVTESKVAQFTRGPWRAVFGPGNKRHFSIFGSDGRELVASMQTRKADGVSVEQVLADSRLMEAAPDMYKALLSIRHWLLFTEMLTDPSNLYLDTFVKANNLANQAIAKAQGRTS